MSRERELWTPRDSEDFEQFLDDYDGVALIYHWAECRYFINYIRWTSDVAVSSPPLALLLAYSFILSLAGAERRRRFQARQARSPSNTVLPFGSRRSIWLLSSEFTGSKLFYLRPPLFALIETNFCCWTLEFHTLSSFCMLHNAYFNRANYWILVYGNTIVKIKGHWLD